VSGMSPILYLELCEVCSGTPGGINLPRDSVAVEVGIAGPGHSRDQGGAVANSGLGFEV
jgi:hypothetical protein